MDVYKRRWNKTRIRNDTADGWWGMSWIDMGCKPGEQSGVLLVEGGEGEGGHSLAIHLPLCSSPLPGTKDHPLSHVRPSEALRLRGDKGGEGEYSPSSDDQMALGSPKSGLLRFKKVRRV